MTKTDKYMWWLDYVVACHRTGSRVICDPPVTDTDDDYICLLDPDNINLFEKNLTARGFSMGGSGGPELLSTPDVDDYWNYYSDDKFFHSWKKDDVNLIITASVEFYENWVKATLLAKVLNLTDKDERIQLFEAITRDVWAYIPELELKPRIYPKELEIN